MGTSGGVSGLGTAVSMIGGFIIGLAGGLLSRRKPVWQLALIGALSGLAGSLFDSLLGATVQQIFIATNARKKQNATCTAAAKNAPCARFCLVE